MLSPDLLLAAIARDPGEAPLDAARAAGWQLGLVDDACRTLDAHDPDVQDELAAAIEQAVAHVAATSPRIGIAATTRQLAVLAVADAERGPQLSAIARQAPGASWPERERAYDTAVAAAAEAARTDPHLAPVSGPSTLDAAAGRAAHDVAVRAAGDDTGRWVAADSRLLAISTTSTTRRHTRWLLWAQRLELHRTDHGDIGVWCGDVDGPAARYLAAVAADAYLPGRVHVTGRGGPVDGALVAGAVRAGHTLADATTLARRLTRP